MGGRMFLIRMISITAFLAALLHHPNLAHAEPTNACTETSRVAVIANAAKALGEQRAELASSFSRTPAGGPADLVVGRLFPTDPAQKLTYRIAFQLGHSDTPSAAKVRLVENRDISAITVPETNRLRVSKAVEQGMTLLSFSVPDILSASSFLQGGMITVIGCKGSAVAFVGHLDTVYSNRDLCIAAAILVTAILYFLIAIAVANYENKYRNPKLSCVRFLDPVVLSSGPNAFGSISRLQILFFSVLLFGILFHILLRVGLLSEMSETVLLLLGISGVGAASSKGVDTQKNLLKFENWAWLINKNWLPANGIASVNVAKWRDVVTGSEGFDVYHFQMLVFSLVVGVALIQVGFGDLAAFVVPTGLLSVLGLSQAVYIGGKLVSPPSTKNLDDALDNLKKAEDDFANEAVRLGYTAPVPPAVLPAATATMPQYREYVKQRELVKTMFQSVFGPLPAAADLNPRYS
jgi:hypothetical protein